MPQNPDNLPSWQHDRQNATGFWIKLVLWLCQQYVSMAWYSTLRSLSLAPCSLRWHTGRASVWPTLSADPTLAASALGNCFEPHLVIQSSSLYSARFLEVASLWGHFITRSISSISVVLSFSLDLVSFSIDVLHSLWVILRGNTYFVRVIRKTHSLYSLPWT